MLFACKVVPVTTKTCHRYQYCPLSQYVANVYLSWQISNRIQHKRTSAFGCSAINVQMYFSTVQVLVYTCLLTIIQLWQAPATQHPVLGIAIRYLALLYRSKLCKICSWPIFPFLRSTVLCPKGFISSSTTSKIYCTHDEVMLFYFPSD